MNPWKIASAILAVLIVVVGLVIGINSYVNYGKNEIDPRLPIYVTVVPIIVEGTKCFVLLSSRVARGLYCAH